MDGFVLLINIVDKSTIEEMSIISVELLGQPRRNRIGRLCSGHPSVPESVQISKGPIIRLRGITPLLVRTSDPERPTQLE